jgi:hypothetical protein
MPPVPPVCRATRAHESVRTCEARRLGPLALGIAPQPSVELRFQRHHSVPSALALDPERVLTVVVQQVLDPEPDQLVIPDCRVGQESDDQSIKLVTSGVLGQLLRPPW